MWPGSEPSNVSVFPPFRNYRPRLPSSSLFSASAGFCYLLEDSRVNLRILVSSKRLSTAIYPACKAFASRIRNALGTSKAEVQDDLSPTICPLQLSQMQTGFSTRRLTRLPTSNLFQNRRMRSMANRILSNRNRTQLHHSTTAGRPCEATAEARRRMKW